MIRLIILLLFYLNLTASIPLTSNYLNELIPRLSKVKRIKLLESDISSISNDTFKGLYLIQSIDVSNLAIKSIEPNSFYDLILLTDLSVRMNQLNYLPDDLLNGYDLRSLKLLDLSFNRLKSIQNQFKPGIRTLEYLSIFNNQIRSIDGQVFSELVGLKHLDLGSNKLASIKETSFTGLINLQTLILNSNQLTSIKPTTFIPFKNSLQYLDLSYNELTQIPIELSNVNHLTVLDLSNNQIQSITQHTFTENVLKTLEILNLESNQIKTVQFPAFKSLNFLSLNHNQVTQLNGSLFKNMNLQSIKDLKVKYNLISQIAEDTFKGFSSLNSLDLSGNRLTSVPVKFIDSICLQTLDITRNPVSLHISVIRKEETTMERGCINLAISGLDYQMKTRKPSDRLINVYRHKRADNVIENLYHSIF